MKEKIKYTNTLIILLNFVFGECSFFVTYYQNDIATLHPFASINVRDSKLCMLKCVRDTNCNAVTLSTSNCSLYPVVKQNNCVANYTKVFSSTTTLYQRTPKKINRKCSYLSKCSTDYGLQCLNGKCNCNSSVE